MIPEMNSFGSLLFAAEGGGGDNGMFMMLIMIVPFMLIFWLLLVRPQKKEEERRMNMYKSLKKNDKVYTVGGIIGIVHTVDLEKKEIVLKLDDSNNTKVKFLISAVASVIQDSSEEKK